MILSSELELKELQTAVSRHLGILPKIRGGGNNAKVWVKQPLLDLLVPVKYLFFVCLVTSLSGCQQLHLKYVFYIFFDFLQWLEIYKNQCAYLLKKA